MISNKITYQPKDRWKIATFVMAIVLTVNVGCFTYAIIKTNNEKSRLQKEIAEKYTKNTANTPKETQTEKSSNQTNRRYLIIKEWDVRFEIPYGLGEVTYELDEAIGSTESEKIPIARLFVTLNDPIPGSDNHYAPFMDKPLTIIGRFGANETPDRFWGTGIVIGKYQYSFQHPHSLYSSDELNITKEIVAVSLLWSAVRTLTLAN